MAQAIQTLYKGYRFRSRLEARYAVFFDNLRIKWRYEAEGYVLKSGAYLPDFHLPDLDFHVEIKPVVPTAQEVHKLISLCYDVNSIGCLMYGDPGEGVLMYCDEVTDSGGGGYLHRKAKWSTCKNCGKSYLVPLRHKMRDVQFYYCDFHTNYNFCACGNRVDTSVYVDEAYTAAKSARFEHGEKG